jgi:peptidoglycan/xylan/chitin deacetylase (PgdA/CDA1 family)
MYKKILPVTLLFAFLLTVFAFLGLRNNAETTATFSFAEERKQVYLTFDDGPSTVVTNSILDTLKEEHVKATFFIVSDRAKTRQETLKRISAEGHTLGVHSATHEYNKIYASDEALLRDVNECAEYIRSVTDVTPRVYRFPGGGSSAKERQTALLEQKGYRVVGWNAVNGDEEKKGASADELYREAVTTSQGKNRVVLLMHDSAHHKETAKALPRIIAYYREQGYEFCAF